MVKVSKEKSRTKSVFHVEILSPGPEHCESDRPVRVASAGDEVREEGGQRVPAIPRRAGGRNSGTSEKNLQRYAHKSNSRLR